MKVDGIQGSFDIVIYLLLLLYREELVLFRASSGY